MVVVVVGDCGAGGGGARGADSTRGPSAYQPNALPLSQTGSRRPYRLRLFLYYGMPMTEMTPDDGVELHFHLNLFDRVTDHDSSS